MSYVKDIARIARVLGPYFSYRGYSAKILPDKTVQYGDAHFSSIGEFVSEIESLIPRRQMALMKSIQKGEDSLTSKIK